MRNDFPLKFNIHLGIIITMRYKYLSFLGILGLMLLYLCTVSAAEESPSDGLAIRPQIIHIHESAGKFARARIIITSNLNHTVGVRIKELTGEITRAILDVDKARITLAPGETMDLGFKGYVPRGTREGNYRGELILLADNVEYRILVNLTVSKSVGNISRSLDIIPLQREIQPGQTLEVISDIRWSGERMDFLYRLQLLDPETGEEILGKSENITVQGTEKVKTNFEIPMDIEHKEYTLHGTLYSFILSENITSTTATVRIKSGLLPPIKIPRPTPDQILLIFLSAVVLLVLFAIYIHYRREEAKKKRYLESIDFTALPRKSPKTGFMGRIAETNAMAFIELNQLQIHTLIAGATGSGKTVAAQVLAEEALSRRKSVIVFDPTAQWTGFLRRTKDRGMFKLYKHFHMKKKDARAFNGNIYTVKDPNDRIDVKKYIKPGEISIFCLNKLDPSMIDVFIENTIKEVFAANLEESPELKVLFVYDEIHRLLPKFGGTGRGFLQIDRAVREFRKWGIGLILISQVLSDFVGEIKANIGTEIQMRSRYENDLERIKLKYGVNIFKSVVKASVGTGMVQNAQYNKGRPYFVSFRPLLHNPRKLNNRELELYDKFNARFDAIDKKIEILKKSDVDTFDIDLELNLAQENLKNGSFTVVDLYLASLVPKIDKYIEKVESDRITEKEKAIRSKWETKKEDEIRAYDDELGSIIEGQKGSISDRERMLTETERREREKLEVEKKKLLEEEAKVKKELELLKQKLESRSQVFEILKRFQEQRDILNEDVMRKEMEKLGDEERELAKEKEGGGLMRKKKELLDKEKKTVLKIGMEREYLEGEANRLRKRLDEIKQDKEIILERDKVIVSSEEKLKNELMDDIQTGFEGKKEIWNELSVEKNEKKREELDKSMKDVDKKLQEDRILIEERGRIERVELKTHRDNLRTQLIELKENWKVLLKKEQELGEKEEKLNIRVREQERLMDEEKGRMEEVGKEWEKVSFEDMEEEWDKMDRLKGERGRLKQELEVIRENLRTWRGLRYTGEEKIRKKEEEIEWLGEKGDNSG